MYSLLGILAFVVWGLAPLYFHKLGAFDPLIILSHRVFWSALILVIIAICRRKLLHGFRSITKRDIGYSLLAGLLMNGSWFGFVYATVSGNLMAASLAFYIAPIMVFGLGLFVFREKITRGQGLALLMMICAVAVYAISEGRLPGMSLAIASAFALYIAVKKLTRLNSFSGLFLEHVLFAPLALFYILFHQQSGDSTLLLSGTAPLQLISVLLLSVSVTQVAMSRMSLIQYIEPTIHFLLAIWVFNEAVSQGQYMALVIILMAIMVSTIKPRLS